MSANISSSFSSLPFGDVLSSVGSSPVHFTGKERDSETGLDYFGARMYASTMGRFLSADWAFKPTTVPYADMSDPQSLNLYAYVRNSPLARIDFDGHQCGSSSDKNTKCVGAGEKTIEPNEGRVSTADAGFAKAVKSDGGTGGTVKVGLLDAKIQTTSNGQVDSKTGKISGGNVNGTVEVEGATLTAHGESKVGVNGAELKVGAEATVAKAGGTLDLSIGPFKLTISGSYVAGWAATASGSSTLPPGPHLALPNKVEGSITGAAGPVGASVRVSFGVKDDDN